MTYNNVINHRHIKLPEQPKPFEDIRVRKPLGCGDDHSSGEAVRLAQRQVDITRARRPAMHVGEVRVMSGGARILDGNLMLPDGYA